jgi:hypothetical protein
MLNLDDAFGASDLYPNNRNEDPKDGKEKMLFKKEITTGNIIQIMLIFLALVLWYSTVNYELSRLSRAVEDVDTRVKSDAQNNAATYVRKDVFDEKLIRFEKSIEKFENIIREQERKNGSK